MHWSAERQRTLADAAGHAGRLALYSRHLRELLAEGRLPECWIPPSHILECRALLETYHDLRAEHTAWVQRIHAVFFHQGEAALRTGRDLQEPQIFAGGIRSLVRARSG